MGHLTGSERFHWNRSLCEFDFYTICSTVRILTTQFTWIFFFANHASQCLTLYINPDLEPTLHCPVESGRIVLFLLRCSVLTRKKFKLLSRKQNMTYVWKHPVEHFSQKQENPLPKNRNLCANDAVGCECWRLIISINRLHCMTNPRFLKRR